jgi:uncharacterized protein YcnI
MRRSHRTRSPLLVLALAAVAGAVPVASAGAHIQVRPAQAAPGDPVLWTVLVPSERETGTRQVELAVPKDVLPFSYEDAPGWTRRVRMNANGSVRSIVWRGQAPADGLATFRFLASTPEREGPIAWKALQTYRDGKLVRWIGAAGSESPASITTITRSATPENAGGEGSEGASPPAASAGATQPSGESDGDGPDWIARGLALAALLVGAAAMVGARRRRSA